MWRRKRDIPDEPPVGASGSVGAYLERVHLILREQAVVNEGLRAHVAQLIADQARLDEDLADLRLAHQNFVACVEDFVFRPAGQENDK